MLRLNSMVTQIDSFSCPPPNTSFLLGKKREKRLPENPEYAETRHNNHVWLVTSFNITMTSRINVRPATHLLLVSMFNLLHK